MGLICAKWLEAVCSTLTKSAERRAPSAERRAPSAERRAPSAERRAPSAERRAPSAERRAPSAERRAPSAERRAPSAERRAPSAERRAPSAEAMTAPRSREQADPPMPPENRPPRRGVRSSSENVSAAGQLHGLRAAICSLPCLAAAAWLAFGLAALVLAVPAQAQVDPPVNEDTTAPSVTTAFLYSSVRAQVSHLFSTSLWPF